MFERLLTVAVLFTSTAFAESFRHTGVKEKGEDYYYIGIGFILPLSNTVKDVADFGLNIDANSEIGEQVASNNIKLTGEQSFPAQKIGGSAFLGYKSRSFWRVDGKVDFITFTRTFQLKNVGNFLVSQPEKIDFQVRQLALLGNLYLDLDNKSSITPYIGAGGGIVFTKASLIMTKGDSQLQEPNDDLTKNSNLVYELKAGIKIGSKKAYFDFEAFKRSTPALKLVSSGVVFKVGFRV